MQKYLLMALILVFPVFASAHVTVMPSEVGVGQRQIFNVSVPTEKEIPTIGVRLIIPEGLQSVRPNVKPGWKVELVKMGEGEDAMVHEIIWTGGSVPADMRDDFTFRAQAPASATTLQWKAYQTYSDGSIVSWDTNEADLPPEGEGDGSKGPYSETEVINDLAVEEVPVVAAPEVTEVKDKMMSRICFNIVAGMSAIALVLSAYAVYSVRCRRTPTTLPQ